MQNLPPELVEQILEKTEDIKDITRLCDSNSRNRNICENYFTHKIKSKFSTSVRIFAELFMKFNIIEIRYAGKTRLRNDSVIIKSHKVYGKTAFMRKFKYLLSEFMKYDDNAGTPFPDRPFDPDRNIDDESLDALELEGVDAYSFLLKNDGENLFLQIVGNNCYRLIISTPDNKLYEKIIYDYLNNKLENEDDFFKPVNPNKGSFPPDNFY